MLSFHKNQLKKVYSKIKKQIYIKCESNIKINVYKLLNSFINKKKRTIWKKEINKIKTAQL